MLAGRPFVIVSKVFLFRFVPPCTAYCCVYLLNPTFRKNESLLQRVETFSYLLEFSFFKNTHPRKELQPWRGPGSDSRRNNPRDDTLFNALVLQLLPPKSHKSVPQNASRIELQHTLLRHRTKSALGLVSVWSFFSFAIFFFFGLVLCVC